MTPPDSSPPLDQFTYEAGPLTRRIHGERLAILGWGRAVLLQFAHPLVAAGIAEHSYFRATPQARLRRFNRTLRVMLVLTYGRPAQVRRVARWLAARHDQVQGRLREATGVFPAGTPYSAHDPALVRWVHATLVESTLLTYQRFLGPLSRAEQDAYCAEATVGMGPDLGLPTDVEQLRAYLAAMYASGQIAVGRTARELARGLLEPSPGLAGLLDLPWAAPYQVITVGLLPPVLRAAYRLRWRRSDQVAFAALSAACRRAVPWLPMAARRWPEAQTGAD